MTFCWGRPMLNEAKLLAGSVAMLAWMPVLNRRLSLKTIRIADRSHASHAVLTFCWGRPIIKEVKSLAGAVTRLAASPTDCQCAALFCNYHCGPSLQLATTHTTEIPTAHLSQCPATHSSLFVFLSFFFSLFLSN
jgi:hypothetical protein